MAERKRDHAITGDTLRDESLALGLPKGELFRPAAKAMCHKMVAEVARAAAHEFYDSLMFDNDMHRMWNARWPGMGAKAREKKFVAAQWPRFIPFARTTLALMLSRPIDEALKESIMDALVKDNSLQHGRPDLNQLSIQQLKAEQQQ